MYNSIFSDLKISKSIRIRNYFLAYLLIFFDTVFFPDILEEALYTITFLSLLVYFFLKKKQLKKHALLFVGVTFIVLLLQTAHFGIFNVPSALNVFMRILYPYLIISIIGLAFLQYFVNIIFVISLISFFFYFGAWIIPGFHNVIHNIVLALNVDSILNQNFIIFTWEDFHMGLLRNAGNFTEPGFFASMLLIAITFNLFITKTFLNRKMVVLIIALATTFSTAGYIGLFTIFMIYFLFKSRSKWKYLAIPVFLYISYISYTELDFLQEKVEDHYEREVIEGGSVGRFSSTSGALQDFSEYPLIGRGLLKQTRFEGLSDYFGQSPYSMMNSITNTLVRYGALGFVILIYLFFVSSKYLIRQYNCPKHYLLILISTVLIACVAQPMLFTPVFVSLFLVKDISPYNFSISYNYKYLL